MNLFNKKSEKEKLMIEREKLNAQLNTVQVEFGRIEQAVRFAEIETLVDPTTANKKKQDKLQNALNERKASIDSLQKEIDEISSKLSAIGLEEKKEEIEVASKAYEERKYTKHKRDLLNNQLSYLESRLYSVTGNPVEPQELKEIAGLKYNEHFKAEHSHLIEAQEKADKKATELAQKDFEELMEQINKFLDL